MLLLWPQLWTACFPSQLQSWTFEYSGFSKSAASILDVTRERPCVCLQVRTGNIQEENGKEEKERHLVKDVLVYKLANFADLHN